MPIGKECEALFEDTHPDQHVIDHTELTVEHPGPDSRSDYRRKDPGDDDRCAKYSIDPEIETQEISDRCTDDQTQTCTQDHPQHRIDHDLSEHRIREHIQIRRETNEPFGVRAQEVPAGETRADDLNDRIYDETYTDETGRHGDQVGRDA